MYKLAVFSKNAPDFAPDRQPPLTPTQQISYLQTLLNILYREV
jgi:hypothetical protein